MAISDTHQLAFLVERKLESLALLVRLGRQQLALIEAGEMGMLLKLLAAKQSLLAQLQDLDRQLDPFRDEDPESRQWPSAAARAECQRQAALCAELLGEAMQLEKQAERHMVRRRDEAVARLQGVHSAAEASHAYAASSIHPLSRAAMCDEN